MTADSALETAIAALRLGRPVGVHGESGTITVVAVETASMAALEMLDPQARAPLLITGRRGAALSLANRREAADPDEPVLIERPSWLDAGAAMALADPGQDMARAPLGPLTPVSLRHPDLARAALALARTAGLLPALWLVEATADVSIGREQLAAGTDVSLVARANLPIDGLPPSQMAAFRSADGHEHAALVIGAFGGEPPLVRLHSECLTGDVFGSLKCDCGVQLKEALRIIGEAGGGILLYLRQEGRGIGLANKLRAYALQDRGLDTVEANEQLGFADDERDYATAAAMLRALGADTVRLLTNNPAKVDALQGEGVGVAERIGHSMPANPHNADYLAVKQRKSGHLL